MLIKYFFQVGNYIDKSNCMVIKLNYSPSTLDKTELIEILEKDQINITDIETIRYYDKQYDGWRLYEDDLILNFSEENNELQMIIKKIDQVEIIETGLIEHLQELNQRILFQESKIKEIETYLRVNRLTHIASMQNSLGGGQVYKMISNDIQSNSANELRKISSSTSMFPLSYHHFAGDSRLDIAFLYSNPLIKIVKDSVISLNEPIDFEKEINNLVDTFKNANKKITARFEIANLDNFQEILRKNPKILHISCHGAYEEVDGSNKFYLYFEDEKGRLDKFDSQKLNNLLLSAKDEQQIEIVFVSACHSEPVADVFRSANIPVVISVHSDTMILDMAAQKFSKIFYDSLLDGKSVKYSYEIAKKVVFTEFDFKNSKILHCCCFHKHKPGCPWKQKANKNNEDAHLLHIKSCKCQFPESHIHAINCVWAKKFKEKLNIQESKSHTLVDKIKVCCCSPEIAHDESNKFIIKTDQMYENTVIFPNLPSGTLDIKNKNFCLNIKFSVDMKTSLIGRNLELYDVINIFKSPNKKNRLVTICGVQGIGKRAFAKLAGIYLFERKNFDAGVYYIETKNFVNEMNLISIICNTLEIDIQISNIHQLLKFIDSKILLIFKFAKMNKESLDDFKKFVDNVIVHTKMIKIMIVSGSPLNSEQENVIHLKNLDPYFASKLLFTLAGEYLPPQLKNDINSLQKHELVKISEGIPSKIQQIAGFLQEGVKLDNLIERMKKENLIKHSLSDELVHVLINNLVNGDLGEQNRVYELLYTLILSPNGLLQRDIIGIYEDKTAFCSILTLLEQFMSQNILIHKKEIKDLCKDVYLLSNDFILSVESLSQSFEKELKVKAFRNLLNFYGKLSRNIVMNLYQNESFSEFSAVQNYGIWLSLASFHKFKVPQFQQEKLYNPIKHYQHTEANLTNLIKFENLSKLFSNLSVASKTEEDQILIESLEQLSICIPTIMKLLGRLTDCMIMIKIFSEILDGFHLTVAKGRLMLFSMSVYPALCSFSHVSIFPGNNEFFLLAPQIYSYFKEADFIEGLAETHFCKAVTMYEIENTKTKSNISKETFQEITRELESSLAVYKELKEVITAGVSKMDKEIIIGYARVCYVLADYQMKSKNYTLLHLDLLKESLTIFEKNNRKYHYVKCLLGISKWYIGKKFLVESKDFAEQALKIAPKLKNKLIEGEVKDLLSDIYDSIRIQSHNVFVFMKAHQLVYHAGLIQTDDEMESDMIIKRSTSNEIGFNSRKQREEAVEPIILHPTNFRERLVETINKAKREIFVKFDVLTNESFADVIKKGGRILHLSSDFFFSGTSLFVEGEFGETEEIDTAELQRLLRNTKCLYDLVILAIPQSTEIAKVFVKAGVPHVICFDFEDSMLEYVYKIVYLPFYNIINDFSVNMLSAIIQEKSIEESFQFAKREFFNFFQTMRDQIYFIDFPTSVGEGPILLPENNNHEMKFYGKFSTEETHLNEGKMMDLSKLRARIVNIQKRNIPLIGRKKETYFAIKNFIYNNNLNIYGDNGVGRTILAKEICYFLSMRHKFKDGIFYFEVNEVISVDGLKDLFEKSQVNLAIEENKKNKNSVIEDRRILIVLDNCDKLIKQNENQFFLYIYSVNKDNNNSVLFLLVSHRKILNPNFLQSDYLHLSPLDRRESTYLFLSQCPRNIDKSEIDHDDPLLSTDPDAEFIELIANSKRLKSCRGYPTHISKLASLTLNQSLDRINFELFLPPKLLRQTLEKEGISPQQSKQKTISFGLNKLDEKEKQMIMNANNSLHHSNNKKRNTLNEDTNALLLIHSIQRNLNMTNPKRKQPEVEISINDLGYENDYKMNRTNAYMKKMSKKKKLNKITEHYIQEIHETSNSNSHSDSDYNSDSSPAKKSFSSSSSSSIIQRYTPKKNKRFSYKDNINYKLAHSFHHENKNKNFTKDSFNFSHHFNSFNKKHSFKNTIDSSINISSGKKKSSDKFKQFSKQDSKQFYESFQKKTEQLLNECLVKKNSNLSNQNKVYFESPSKNTINENMFALNFLNSSGNRVTSLANSNQSMYSKFVKNKSPKFNSNTENKFNIFQNDRVSEGESPNNINMINIESLSILNNFEQGYRTERNPNKNGRTDHHEKKITNYFRNKEKIKKKGRKVAREVKFKNIIYENND